MQHKINVMALIDIIVKVVAGQDRAVKEKEGLKGLKGYEEKFVESYDKRKAIRMGTTCFRLRVFH